MSSKAISALLLLLVGCANSAPHGDAAAAPSAMGSAAPPTTTSVASAAPPPATASASAAPPQATAIASAAAPSTAEPADAGAGDAGATAFAADNKVSPTEGEELTARARGLFDAIVKDDPALGDPFWFPKEPFIPLKDVKDPGKYWEQLHRTFVADIHALHKKRKSWSGATFTAFTRGSNPKWVKPGDEANKIGYYRSFHGQLKFDVDGKSESIDIHTVITWQGRWYITHLRKFKH